MLWGSGRIGSSCIRGAVANRVCCSCVSWGLAGAMAKPALPSRAAPGFVGTQAACCEGALGTGVNG